MSAAARLAEALLPEGRAGYALVSRTFDFMEIAEEEIVAGLRRYPRSRRRVWCAFGILQPRHLIETGEGLYRAHCRELVARVARGEETRTGTRAEVLATISRMTLASRLDRDVELLGLRLAEELLGAKDLVEHRRESYAGALDAVLDRMRRRHAVEDRVVEEREPPPGAVARALAR